MPRSKKWNQFGATVKERFREGGWTVARGFAYRVHGDYIYSADVQPPYGGVMRGQLSVKPLALDPVFWDIVGLSHLKIKRVGFRVTGTFTVRPAKIVQIEREVADGDDLAALSETMIDEIEHALEANCGRFATLSDYEQLLEPDPAREHEAIRRLIWLIARDELEEAKRSARRSIQHAWTGGFGFPDGDVFEIALDYLTDLTAAPGDPPERRWVMQLPDGHAFRIRDEPSKSIDERIAGVLRRMEEEGSFRILWMLPPRSQLHQLDLALWPREYMQCAGSPETGLTCEIRIAGAEGLDQYALGHPGRAGEDVRIGWCGRVSTVPASEVLSGEEVIDAFCEYRRAGRAPVHLEARLLDL